MQLFIFIVHSSAPQLIQVVFKSDRTIVPNHWVPIGDDASVFDTLIVGGRTVVMSMVDPEAPLTVLPQQAIPFGVIRLLVAALETVREGGMFVLVGLVLQDGM